MNKNLIKRESYINQLDDYIDSDFVKVFIGIRRSGKTSLLYSLMDEIENRGVNKENILFISFESPEYNLIEDFQELDKIVYSLTKDITGKIYLFFDEIQNVSNWEKSINGYRVSLDCDIYITGSNSKLLSNELSTLLAGRYLKINVYPFSFKEFIQYKEEIEEENLNFYKIKEYSKFKEEILSDKFNLFKLQKYLEYYTNFGGMPSILTLKGENIKKAALNDIYDSIILNDIINRFNIRNIDLFKRYLRFMISSTGQTYSSKKIKNYLKENNIRTSQDTLLRFNDYLQQSFFLLKCRRQDLIGKKEMKIYEKYYLSDHGFHNALIENNKRKLGRIVENMVYVELLRRGYEVNVGKIYDKEIDFVCKKDGNIIYIQVAYKISSEEVYLREFGPLYKIKDKYDTYVISTDDEDLSHEGVKHLNLLEFLIGDEI